MFEEKHHSTMLREENVKRVKRWLSENHGKTRKDCCHDLKISYPTLKSITDQIKAEENGE